ncbi:acyl-CoA dehydrogenase [Alcanivorax sp. HI0033]|uniref:acyl-CoA dehydrogenase family protein n=1 Tax=unclassified Alcanivorax TaxID=2638842 RepID=UPI0007B9ABBE|nr:MULTISPECIES: acyl-CoA dehydrogenase family protein [unclassified Alcanivorax]KZX75343.1 acyl-CoA dehydrogenase [Alcanivorax sp. HI0011]KZX79919.1 acyl-CoA dehydrogenase [Alcanivorax sp. HI0013]KZY14508.1 acyl-CoA dehydrogenase [Alcanivorax sp. HI0035]KZX65875.1 acyl-CoA dehydrogenase [Alcanivorax sp. HI0003]KZX67245.1 acyl-CoA dehydrogenase [Alcanivorax sp. HI0007]
MSALDYFNETHQMVRETVRKFVEREILPHVDDWEEAGEFPRELYHKAADAGILSINAPEEFGGTGEDVFMKIAACEELVRCSSGGLCASLGSLDIGLPPIWKWGSNAMKQKVVPEVIGGQKISALAITEPNGGSDVANLRTRAVRDGDHYVVNGAKTFITSGVRADYYTVAVRTGDKGYGGISLLLVEKGTPGFSVGRKLKKMGWWASDTAELFFEDCRVPAENLIGPENGGFYCIMSNFQMERLILAVTANSTAQLALDEAMRYVKEREAFGRPLAGFQVTRHKLAEMATDVKASTEFTYRVAARIAAGENCVLDVSMAKNVATRCADRVTYDAVQLFGGSGYMRGTVVERLYRDNRILSIGGGTHEIMNEVIAKQLGL